MSVRLLGWCHQRPHSYSNLSTMDEFCNSGRIAVSGVRHNITFSECRNMRGRTTADLESVRKAVEYSSAYDDIYWTRSLFWTLVPDREHQMDMSHLEVQNSILGKIQKAIGRSGIIEIVHGALVQYISRIPLDM